MSSRQTITTLQRQIVKLRIENRKLRTTLKGQDLIIKALASRIESIEMEKFQL